MHSFDQLSVDLFYMSAMTSRCFTGTDVPIYFLVYFQVTSRTLTCYLLDYCIIVSR